MTRIRSSMTVERIAVATIRPRRAFLELFPDHFRTMATMRREMVDFSKNIANAKQDMQMTIATLTPEAQVVPASRMPSRGTAAAYSQAVTRMGIASVIHRRMEAKSRPIIILPSKDRPTGFGMKKVITTIRAAIATTATLKDGFSLILKPPYA